MSSQGPPPLRTITIDLGKPLRSVFRLIAIPVSTFYRITKVNSVFLLSRVEVAGPRDFEEIAGLLANDDLYDDDSDSAIRPTPEERDAPVIRPSKARLLQRDSNSKYARSTNLLTKLSLCISGLSFLVLITALIIIPAGGFGGSGSWTSMGYHRHKGEAAIGLAISSITTFICFVSALRNVRKPMPVGISAFLDLMFVSVLFPMVIYAITIGYPTQNWCGYWDECLVLVRAEKALVVVGAVFGFVLSFIHFVLLILRASIIKDRRPWKRPSNVKFSFFRIDFDVTVMKRTRRHTCTCCAQLAASGRVGGVSSVTSLLAYVDDVGRVVEV
ncbi:hypothetical protein BKA64DRAFT_703569 [Cadophora sp. MPI-SDFR-AT-0126]|nr:hypothetical protein BKA64DRAFT_703569 [Leotiomycetes sp. MPI-SDFR-AT-0126]